jgi:hypothetical protein
MRVFRKAVASVALAAASVTGAAALAGPASAAPIVAGNLVGVNVSNVDVLTENQVLLNDVADVNANVPIGIAANVCGVSVAVLATALGAGDVRCDALASPRSQAAIENIQRFAAVN